MIVIVIVRFVRVAHQLVPRLVNFSPEGTSSCAIAHTLGHALKTSGTGQHCPQRLAGVGSHCHHTFGRGSRDHPAAAITTFGP